MKSYFIFLLFLTSLFMQAQSNRVSGAVYIRDINFLKDTILSKPVSIEIYYVTDSCGDGEKKLMKKSNGSTFDFRVSKSKLKKYTYIQFKTPKQYQSFPIKALFNVRQKIIFDSFKVDEPTMIVKKPAIYLYPETEQKISILHQFKGQILNTYPLYQAGWQVVAKPDGKILNLNDNREYSYLFWDGAYRFPASHYQFDSGFYVKKEETIKFLQEKLAWVGLNNTEINDFIVFWLPALSEHDLNFIHFRINDHIDNSSFLSIDPKPATEIRLFMEFKPMTIADILSKLPEQELPKIKRKGFTMIEWGGAEMQQITLP